jgi:hypothetical protein
MQFINNLKTSFAALPGETKKMLLILGGLGGGLFLVFIMLITMFLTSSQRSTTTSSESPEVTQTPEEIASITRDPYKPTDIPFISKDDIDAVIPHFTPTPTPLPGEFYIPNGQQNNLEIRYAYFDKGDVFEEVRIMNTKTLEVRPIGYMYRYTLGKSAFFSNDFSQIIYLGGTKIDYQKITVYSIPQNKNLAYITLDQMKQALPQLEIDQTAVLSRLEASPDKSRVALSYGNTFATTRITPDTQIIIIRLADNEMQLLPVRGLVKGWTSDTTLQYEVNNTSGENSTFEVISDI